jgi:pyrimidine-nucleoside phosphorylase
MMTNPTNPTHWIEQKKNGVTHTPQEVHALVNAVMEGHMKDYQLSAWLMAVCLNGLNEDETFALTEAFVKSGTVLDFKALGVKGVVVDKHSTGGVGDKVTLVLSPLLAACGLKVAKLSGRGLGFTGGTIDKLEAIPGFNIALSEEQFLNQLDQQGLALSAQTASLAPADGIFYALRDVTATVDNLSLIAASVVSKKIASGAEVIVLDVKYGEGAFMKTREEATTLAELCTRIGERFGRRMKTILSSMEAPLGRSIGHTVEVAEAIETLQGQGHPDVEALCLHLAAVALVGAGQFPHYEEAHHYASDRLKTGEALSAFRGLVQAQGGDINVIESPELMPQPTAILPVLAEHQGYIHQINALAIAKAVKQMGGGRTSKTDALDLSVGVVLRKSVGDAVAVGEPLFDLWAGHHRTEEAKAMALQAFTIQPEPLPQKPDLFHTV